MNAQQRLHRANGQLGEPRRLLGPISPARFQMSHPSGRILPSLLRRQQANVTPEQGEFPGMIPLPSPQHNGAIEPEKSAYHGEWEDDMNLSPYQTIGYTRGRLISQNHFPLLLHNGESHLANGFDPSTPSPAQRQSAYDYEYNFDSPSPARLQHAHNHGYIEPQHVHNTGYNVSNPSPYHQRVLISPSMLCAYSHMRGHNLQLYDPLHHALFPAADATLYHERMYLPVVQQRASLEG